MQAYLWFMMFGTEAHCARHRLTISRQVSLRSEAHTGLHITCASCGTAWAVTIASAPTMW
jgi:hypothetical protein